ncbi:MAG: biopolymer transporter ExbD [Planctomycetaceae bacterium]
MRIPSHHNRRSSLDAETMTPMIDVVFLLLVFFVCASIGQTPDALLPAELRAGVTDSKVEIAEPDPDEWKSPEVMIRLRAPDGAGRVGIEVNDRIVSGPGELTATLARLADLDRRSRIILDVDDAVPTQQFIAVYDLCQSLSFEVISFAVRR